MESHDAESLVNQLCYKGITLSDDIFAQMVNYLTDIESSEIVMELPKKKFRVVVQKKFDGTLIKYRDISFRRIIRNDLVEVTWPKWYQLPKHFLQRLAGSYSSDAYIRELLTNITMVGAMNHSYRLEGTLYSLLGKVETVDKRKHDEKQKRPFLLINGRKGLTNSWDQKHSNIPLEKIVY